ncbi:MAG: ATP-binding protein [Gammaproteobacteria bacterium]|nr:ATP-binding protein [Gammaproteobacteria bacterium]
MIARKFWLSKIALAWKHSLIVWLAGVRRVGKTTLAQMLSSPTSRYLNCDLPSVQRELDDPELFLESLATGIIVMFDEVHRLSDPSTLLKLAADTRPDLRVLATGSSTLVATKKFRDSLTGRKRVIHLTPILWSECISNFDVQDLDHRLLRGGLPQALLANDKDPEFFSEWIDSLYARDIQELFSIRNRVGFLSLLRLLLRQSGGQLDYTKLARLTELSRPTVKSYIEALQIACVVHLVPPLGGSSSSREIVSRPKCYCFDSGFVTHEKGWDTIRVEDRGILWEHLILDSLLSQFRREQVFYWRDKSNKEIDFVIRTRSNEYHTIECKVDPDSFSSKSLAEFRTWYPEGKNFVVSPHTSRKYHRSFDSMKVTFLRDIKNIV